MVNVEYANAYREILEILQFISKEDFEKIPKNLIELFEEESNKKYVFSYNPDKTLEEQNVSKRARAIITILYRDYWADEEQKEKIKIEQKKDILTIEEQKKLMYDYENMFKNRNDYAKAEAEAEETKIIVVQKENRIIKFINKIKSFFRR